MSIASLKEQHDKEIEEKLGQIIENVKSSMLNGCYVTVQHNYRDPESWEQEYKFSPAFAKERVYTGCIITISCR